jgi:hypothetical protein
MFLAQLLHNFYTILTTFYYDQPLDLFSYIWAMNIQWLILKKIKFVRVVQETLHYFLRAFISD